MQNVSHLWYINQDLSYRTKLAQRRATFLSVNVSKVKFLKLNYCLYSLKLWKYLMRR